MSVTFTAAEIEQISRAMQLLASPLDHPDPDVWRSEVVHVLKGLLHADTGGFHLPVDDRSLFYSEDYPEEVFETYPDVQPPLLPNGMDPVEAGLRTQVGTLEALYDEDRQIYHRSVYYNEYASLIGKHDTLFTMHVLPGGDPAAPEEEAASSLQFFHERRTGRRFGDREIAILRLLFPAFQAGTDSYARLGRHRADLIRIMDDLAVPTLVMAMDGQALHRTPALMALLRDDREKDLLEREMARIGRIACGLARGDAGDGRLPGMGLSCEIATRSRRYRARAATHTAGSARPFVLVSIDPLTPGPLPEAELAARFGLTPAEIRVARLLGERKSNAEIATALYISPHTARRHTERVLQKLGVTSRADVRAKVVTVPGGSR